MTTTLIVIGGLVLLFLIYFIYNFWRMKNMDDVAPNNRIKILSEKNFQHQIKKGVSLVDFWASWCVPCKMMSPVLNDVAEEVGDQANICKLNVEQYPQVASQYRVNGIPTLLLFRNGKEISRFVGVKSKDYLLQQIGQVK